MRSGRNVLLQGLAVVVLALQAGAALPATADTTPPPAPVSVAAASGPGSVGLIWPHVDAADRAGYAVYRSTSLPVPTTGTPRSGNALLTDRQYVDTSAANGTTYHYVVVAVDGTGNRSAPSQAVSAVPTAPAPPSGDPITWATRAAAAIGRAEANGGASGGKLYVFGGQDAKVRQTARSDVYDPATDTWARLPDLPELITHAPVVDVDGVLWLLGGYLGLDKKDSTDHVWKYDTATRTYSPGPPLPAPRGGGAAARVGRSLHYFAGAIRRDSVGGDVQDFADHWVLDLDGGTAWQPSTPVPNPRNHVAAVALGSDVYLIGGQHGEFEKTTPQTQVDVWNATTGAWRSAAPLPVARGHISASAFPVDGKILAVGGSTVNGTASDTVYEYDPGTNSWRTRTSLPAARKSPVAELFDGEIVVSGGRQGTGVTTTTFAGPIATGTPPPDLGTWTTAPPLPVQRVDAGGAELGGKVYVVGGKDSGGPRNELFAYDPATGGWDTTLPPKPGTAVENPAVVAWNGVLLVIGGSSAAFSGAVADVHRYDPTSRSWSALAPMRTPRGGPAAAVLGDSAWVVGGMSGTGASLASTERLDLLAGTWSAGPAMPTARDNPGAAAVGGLLHVFGGRTRTSSGTETAPTLATHHALDPATGTWSARAPMPTGRRTMAVGLVDGRIVAAGGEKQPNGSTFPQTERYDPGTDTWTTLAAMPTPRHGAAAAVLDGRLHTVGGGPTGGSSFSAVHEVLDPPGSSSPPPPGDTTPPAAPQGLTGSAGAGPVVDLAWTASREVDLAGYAVYRSAGTPVSTSGTPLSGAGLLTSPAFRDATVVAGQSYSYAVVARDTSGNTSTASAPVTVAVPGGTAAPAVRVKFTTTGTTPPSGYLSDSGQSFGSRTGTSQGSGHSYGWVRVDDGRPVDLTKNVRERTGTTTTDPRLIGLLHMQWTSSTKNGTRIPGAWELAVPNGDYDVTVSAGDAGDFYDSVHRLVVEGTVAVASFVPSAAERFRSATVRVPVADGRLTVTPAGGTNTKINYVDVVPASAEPPPPPPPPPSTSLDVTFTSAGTVPPAGYVRDSGEAFGERTGADQGTGQVYGWVRLSDRSPVDLTKNARARTGTSTADPTLTGLMHMQWSGSSTSGTSVPGAWEAAVPNGSYVVTVVSGDAADHFDSTHWLSVEDQNAVAVHVPSDEDRFRVATVTVTVTDGRLTVSPARGANTKLVRVGVRSAPAPQPAPRIVEVTPANLATDQKRDLTVTAGLALTGGGIDADTLSSSTVRLTTAGDGATVAAVALTSGGGDVISVTPSAPLQSGESYRLDVTSGVKDTSGTAFEPWSSVFTVGSTSSGTGIDGVAFAKVATNATGKHWTSVTTGPDGRLYAATLDGYIFRWPIAADGSLGGGQQIDTVRRAAGTSRTILGLAFAPGSTASSLTLYVTSNVPYVGADDVPDWTSSIVRLTGPDLENAQDVVVRLPRSNRDHESNSLAFGPDGALYLTQGSNTAMGAPDSAWGMRPERILSAAVLRLDLTRLPSTLPLDVKTEEGGSYNPFAAGAPLTLYGTGVRNAYDLVWHSNGNLYVPTNGSARGGNVPATPSTLPSSCSRRIDGAWTGPATPGITGNPQDESDWVFRVVDGGYYGHPNPARCEWAFNGGDPTSAADPFEATAYPTGVLPDRNYRIDDVFDIGLHASANGTIEYGSDVFGAAMKGKVVVVRYSASQDLVVLDVGGPGGKILSRAVGVTGFTGFDQPLDVAQHVPSGNLYVTELGGMRITRLVPQP